MDEEAVPGSAASSDPGYHDDDELAAVLAAQLEQIIETGSIPLQREAPPRPAVPATTGATSTGRAGVPTSAASTPPASSEPPQSAADARRSAEPPTLTGPLRPPSHRADLATTATGPSAAVPLEHRPEHRADRQPIRAAHRTEAQRGSEPPAGAPAPTGAIDEVAPRGVWDRARDGSPEAFSTRPVAPSAGAAPALASDASLDTGRATPSTGSVPLSTAPVSLDAGGLPLDTGSAPLSRRARRAAERALSTGEVPVGPQDPPRTHPVDLPYAAGQHASPRSEPAPRPSPASSIALPQRALPEPFAGGGEDAGDGSTPPRRRSFRPPPEQTLEPDPQPSAAPERAADTPDHLDRQAPAPAEAAWFYRKQASAERLDQPEPAPQPAPEPEPHHTLDHADAAAAEQRDGDEADGSSPASSDGWSRALRIIGGPVGEDEQPEDPGSPEPSPVQAGTWFEEPLPTTGTIVLSGSPTGPVPVAEPDDDGEVDEVESAYGAVSADTAAVGVLPPMVDDSGRHVVPAISRGSLDRELVPEAVLAEPPTPTLRSGLLAPLATWAGAAGSPLAIIAGFSLGGGPSTLLGLVLGLVLAVPAVLRLGSTGARSGRDAVRAARASLGAPTGMAAGIVLLVGRVGIATIGLLGVAELATSFAGRTGLGGSLPASGSAILAVLLAGLLVLAIGAWPGRIVGVVLGAAGAVALFASASLLVLLSGSTATAPATAQSPIPAAVAGFALVGLVVASGAAEVARRPLAGSPWRLGVVGTVLGAAAAAVVIALGGAVAGEPAAGASATDAFVGAVVDGTSVALVAPIAVLLLLSSLALVAVAARGAGAAAVSLLERGRSSGLGTAAAALVAIALALAALAGGLGASAALLTFGALLGVPLTAVLAALTVAPTVRRSAGLAPLVALGVTVLVGWLLVDHLLVAGERSPILDLLGMPSSSAWRAVPAVGLLVAAIGGAVAGGLAHLRRQGAPDVDATERLPAMQSAGAE